VGEADPERQPVSFRGENGLTENQPHALRAKPWQRQHEYPRDGGRVLRREVTVLIDECHETPRGHQRDRCRDAQQHAAQDHARHQRVGHALAAIGAQQRRPDCHHPGAQKTSYLARAHTSMLTCRDGEGAPSANNAAPAVQTVSVPLQCYRVVRLWKFHSPAEPAPRWRVVDQKAWPMPGKYGT